VVGAGGAELEAALGEGQEVVEGGNNGTLEVQSVGTIGELVPVQV
jgi:hypothetical protein